MIYHIRKKLRKQKVNQYYKDNDNRDNGTYCGLPETEYDIRWYDKAIKFGDHEPCPKCIEIRQGYQKAHEQRKAKEQAYKDCGLVKVKGSLGGTYWE